MGPAIRHLHPWDLDEEEARATQKRLAKLVDLTPTVGLPPTAAGVDVAYAPGSDVVVAVVVVLETVHFEVVEEQIVRAEARFGYQPGLLSFRELPSLIVAIEQLSVTPGLIVCDGHGYAHPERFGLACHLGVLCDVPTIGCAKTPFVGEFVEPDPKRGSRSAVVDRGEIIGHALRTQDEVKPVFVSPGNGIDFESATDVVLALTSRFRLPETTRAADRLGRRTLRAL